MTDTMQTLRVLLLLATLGATLPLTHAAPTPDELVNRWIEAIGGRPALEKLTSRQAKATIKITAIGMNADLVYLGKNPDLRLTEVTFAGIGTIREGFDGKVAWSQNPGTPPVEKSGRALEQARRESVFRQEIEFNKLYPTREVEGSATVGDREAWILKATATNGDVETFYLDKTSGLLLKKGATILTPQGPTLTEVWFEDYKTVDGITIPHRLRMDDPPALAFTLQFTEIRHNLPTATERFKKPAD